MSELLVVSAARLDGKIKSRVEDFIVTEVALNGYPVDAVYDAVGKYIPLHIPSSRTYLADTSFTPMNLARQSTNSRQSYLAALSGDVRQVALDLKGLVGEALYERLQAFAADATSTAHIPQGFSLGIFPNKSERARLHAMVRVVFPALDLSSSGGLVAVGRHAAWPTLLDILGAAQAHRLMEYAARAWSSSDPLDPPLPPLLLGEVDKTARTLLHRLVAQHLSHLR